MIPPMMAQKAALITPSLGMPFFLAKMVVSVIAIAIDRAIIRPYQRKENGPTLSRMGFGRYEWRKLNIPISYTI